MVLLNSEKIPLGQSAKEFELESVDGKTYSIQSFKDSKVLVIMFICNHCPYVQAIEDRIIALQRYFEKESVQLVGICSNDPTDYPDDSRDALLKVWTQKEYRFPYLIDASQEVAKSFGAVCTPDIYVFDGDRKLAYHGRLDDNWQKPEAVEKEDLKRAIECILRDQPIPFEQISSMGCSIKWKKD